MNAILFYFIAINIVAFVLMGIDKKRARKHQYRIKESSLLGCAAIGGCIGILLGMYFFHHKTKKKKFRITVPLFLLLYFCIFIYVQYTLYLPQLTMP